MRKLPRAGTAQNNQLDHHPPHNARVRGFGLVAEFGLPLLFIKSALGAR